jgi:hypothetical protein
MFALIACILFAVAAFGGHVGSFNLVDIGLAFVALALLTGGIWPFGGVSLGRRP